jgi:TonB family protein
MAALCKPAKSRLCRLETKLLSAKAPQATFAKRSSFVAFAAVLLAGATAGAAEEIELELSAPQSLPNGFWQYRVLRGAALTKCQMENEPARYAWHTVRIENVSKGALKCSARLTCTSGVCWPTSSTSGNTVLLPSAQTTLIRACMRPESTYEIKAECQSQALRPTLKVPANCRYELTPPPDLEHTYPLASQRFNEQGVVDVAFTLAEREGLATNVEIVSSSAIVRLDDAATRLLRQQRMRTTCPGTRFEMRMSFQLDSDAHGTVSIVR